MIVKIILVVGLLFLCGCVMHNPFKRQPKVEVVKDNLDMVYSDTIK